MGIIVELAHAKKRIKELETKIVQLSTPPPAPIVRAEITYAELSTLLRKKFPEAQLFISDSIQYLCGLEDVNAFLTQDETNRIQYVSEKMDCDDFAYRLQGQFSIPEWSKIAMGLIWTDVHALNGFIDANKEFWWIEPQSDKVQTNLESWQGSKIRLIMM